MDSQPILWYVYILELGDGEFYTGQTNDLDTRLVEHTLDVGAIATKGTVHKLVWFSHTHSREAALLELAPSIQERVSTSDGVAGVGALSELARWFTPEDQEEALEEIGGFKQDLQRRILRDSRGNLDQLPGLKDAALEDDLDVKLCREGLCFSLPSPIKHAITKAISEGEGEITLKEFADRIGQL